MASDEQAGDDPSLESEQEEGNIDESTGLRGRTYPQHEEILQQLPPNFRKGITTLQEPEYCPDARIVTVSSGEHKEGAGFVFISLGVWQIAQYADYNRDEAEVFIRLKENFPNGKNTGSLLTLLSQSTTIIQMEKRSQIEISLNRS